MMTSMVKQIARASFTHWRQNANQLGVHMEKGQHFEDMTEGEMRFALAHARANIAALREPNEEMIECMARATVNSDGWNWDKDRLPCHTSKDDYRVSAREVWVAGIDAALAGEPE